MVQEEIFYNCQTKNDKYLFFVCRAKQLNRFQIDTFHSFFAIFATSFAKASSNAEETYAKYNDRNAY